VNHQRGNGANGLHLDVVPDLSLHNLRVARSLRPKDPAAVPTSLQGNGLSMLSTGGDGIGIGKG
jgi:hypothetical protein